MRDPTFCRFSRTPTCDRHRHRQTQTDRHRPMASTADVQHRAVKTEFRNRDVETWTPRRRAPGRVRTFYRRKCVASVKALRPHVEAFVARGATCRATYGSTCCSLKALFVRVFSAQRPAFLHSDAQPHIERNAKKLLKLAVSGIVVENGRCDLE